MRMRNKRIVCNICDGEGGMGTSHLGGNCIKSCDPMVYVCNSSMLWDFCIVSERGRYIPSNCRCVISRYFACDVRMDANNMKGTHAHEISLM